MPCTGTGAEEALLVLLPSSAACLCWLAHVSNLLICKATCYVVYSPGSALEVRHGFSVLHALNHTVYCAALQKYFNKVVRLRVDASRSMSREFYAIGVGRKRPPALRGSTSSSSNSSSNTSGSSENGLGGNGSDATGSSSSSSRRAKYSGGGSGPAPHAGAGWGSSSSGRDGW